MVDRHCSKKKKKKFKLTASTITDRTRVILVNWRFPIMSVFSEYQRRGGWGQGSAKVPRVQSAREEGGFGLDVDVVDGFERVWARR